MLARVLDLARVEVGHSCACNSPPRQRSAAAVSTAWRVPPIPIARWSFVPRMAAQIDAVTSPSWISLIRAPAARISSIRSWCRGRSRTIAVTSFDDPAEGVGDRADVVADRARQADPAARARPDRHLPHVHVGERRHRAGGAAAIIEIAPLPPRANTAAPLERVEREVDLLPARADACRPSSCSASSRAPITIRPLIGRLLERRLRPENDASSARLLVGAAEPARSRERGPLRTRADTSRTCKSGAPAARCCRVVGGLFWAIAVAKRSALPVRAPSR